MSASDIGHTAGEFHWADGSPVDEKLWEGGFPNRYGAAGEACVYLYTGNVRLFDDVCTAGSFFLVCEAPTGCH